MSVSAYIVGSPSQKTFKLSKKFFWTEWQDLLSMEIRDDNNKLVSPRHSLGFKMFLRPKGHYGVIHDNSLRTIIFLAYLYLFSLSIPKKNIYIRFFLQKTRGYVPGTQSLCTTKHLFLKNGLFLSPVNIHLLKQILDISFDSEDSARNLARLMLNEGILCLNRLSEEDKIYIIAEPSHFRYSTKPFSTDFSSGGSGPWISTYGSSSTG